MESSTIQFFHDNDNRINNMVCRILLWLILIFPTLFLLSFLHVFRLSFKELFVLTPIGCVCIIIPTILKKAGASTVILKYCSVLALSLIVAIMGSNSNVGIYMTYTLALAISCLYFDVHKTHCGNRLYMYGNRRIFPGAFSHAWGRGYNTFMVSWLCDGFYD